MSDEDLTGSDGAEIAGANHDARTATPSRAKIAFVPRAKSPLKLKARASETPSRRTKPGRRIGAR